MEDTDYGQSAIMALNWWKMMVYRQEKHGKLQLKKYLKESQAVLLKDALEMFFYI